MNDHGGVAGGASRNSLAQSPNPQVITAGDEATTMPATSTAPAPIAQPRPAHSTVQSAETPTRLAPAMAASCPSTAADVAIVAGTSPEFFDGLFGALLAGAVAVPLYPPVRLGRLEAAALRYESK